MTIHAHQMQAIARERTADLLRDAAAYRLAAEARQAVPAARPAGRSQAGQSAAHNLIPAGAQKR
jgi:hypothetical protein